jgi:uncharacterized protein RhaS with RHS repeats
LPYYRARYYDPTRSRFLSEDPIGLDGGINGYAYVGGAPTHYVDPLGLRYAEAWAAQGAVIGGTVAAVGSVVADAATGGVNIPATPAEIAAGAALGAAAGYALGSIADRMAAGNSIAGPVAPPDAMQLAKGGTQNIENEWSRAARLQPDPCRWLREQYEKAGDSATRQKIKTAQKVLRCRRSSESKEDCQ